MPEPAFLWSWHFTKWYGLNIVFVIQDIRCFKNFCGTANTLLHIHLKMENNMMKISSPVYSLKLKNIILFLTRGPVLIFFKWSYSQRCFDVAQHCENLRWKWQRCFDVVTFNVDVHNVVSTLVWRCTTSRRHINLKATLKRRSNVCWVNDWSSCFI